MLSLYDSFIVPNIPNVQIYRDDENRHRFYMVPERATIARDDEGKPLFNFVLYARDVDRLSPDDRQVERGYLQLTTQAGVTKETEDKIRAYLKQKLEDEQRGNYWFLGLLIRQTEPELSYPPLWLDGDVEFRGLPNDMVPVIAGSTKPSLMGSNIASFSASLTQDGAEFFRQTVEKNIVPAGVWYKLSFAARIPAIKIVIHGDKGEFYKEVKNYIRHRWEHTQTRSFLGVTYSRSTWVQEWDELSSITKFRNSFHNLTITVDDSSLPNAGNTDMKQKLEDMAFSVFQTNILPTFFEPALQDVAKEQQGTQNPANAIPVNTETTGTIDVVISRSEIVEKKVNPSAVLSQTLTSDEIKAATAYIDLGQPFFQELDVTVNANVNFQSDPVFGLKVFLDYDQQDEIRNTRIKKAKEILFKDSEKAERFRQVMAKGSDGAPKDAYKYWSEIIYKETGETIRIPAQGAMESRDRQLVISYARLGFVKVALVLGAMPDNIKAAQIKITYPGSMTPSAQQTIELTREQPTAAFFTYTGHPGTPKPYRYQLSYVLADGQRMDLPEQSGQSETLRITNPFEQTLTTRFLAQADFSVVQKIIVDAHYRDVEKDFSVDHHAELSNNGDTSAWAFGLRNPSKRDFTYNVVIIYKNGSREEQSEKSDRTLGDTIPVGVGAVAALEVTTIASELDWSKYKLVLVFLDYLDEANGIHETKNFTFRSANSTQDQLWKVLLRNKQLKTYRYKVRYVGQRETDSHETEWMPTDDPVLVVQ